MKKFLIGLLFLSVMFSVVNALAMETTANCDKDRFQYEVQYEFATSNLVGSLTAVAVPINSGSSQTQFVVTRGYSGVLSTSDIASNYAHIVGISVSGGNICMAGSATFDVTINGKPSGIQAVIEPVASSPGFRASVGSYGSTGSQYSWCRQDRDDDRSAQGFKATTSQYAGLYDSVHPYGKATSISAGDRIGVIVTTSSTFLPSNNYTVDVYDIE